MYKKSVTHLLEFKAIWMILSPQNLCLTQHDHNITKPKRGWTSTQCM